MTQASLILFGVKQSPGLTATGYTRLLFPGANTHKPAGVITTLNRFVKKGILTRKSEPGMRKTVNAWRFYPV